MKFSIVCLVLPLFSPLVTSDGLMERSERSASAVALAEKSHSSPYEFYGKPFYGKTTTDVIVQEGNHAFFHCLVHNLGNQTVSWVRNADSHMLFIGRDRFVHDDRYELISSRHGKWTLKLKYVTARDAGRFECQVSTQPKLNQTFSLKVVVPTVKVLGDLEMYVKAGTAVTLRCLISNCLEEPAYVFWYHGDRRLLDDNDQIPGDLIEPTTPKPTSHSKKTRGKNRRKIPAMTQAPELDLDQLFFRGGIKILTQRLVADGSAISTVTIRNPTPAHSGKYTCRPANLEPAFVNLHVIQEEKPAAMQHESPSLQSSASSSNSGSSSSETAAASSQAEVKSSIESASIASRTTTTILSWITLLFINI